MKEIHTLDELLQISRYVEDMVSNDLSKAREVEEYNQIKVVRAFIKHRVSDFHFSGSSGYGYNDSGREVLDELFAEIFGAESGLVRWQFVSGTHAIASCLFGLLRPGDEFVSVAGSPYDTLGKAIGLISNVKGSILDWGIKYKEIPLLEGKVDINSFERYITHGTKLAFIQRSRGYSWRKSLSIDDISLIISRLKEINKDIIVLVDNCYGEFAEKKEPSEAGADIVAGSLIKNPGGGICPTGGYVAGRDELVEQVANRLTAPGIGREVGATLNINRTIYQGIYLAPLLVSQAMQGMIWAGSLFQELGFITSPGKGETRGDIVQAIQMNSEDKLIAFCQAIQSNSPVDAHLSLEGAYMPGYGDKVVMASGTFIQGASLELTADGPVRPPYIAYLQGGLSYFHIKYSILKALESIYNLNVK